jgi:hypothetical protein
MVTEKRLPLSFLLANWYSGATLLTLLLNKHPHVVSNGELFPGRTNGEVKRVDCSCRSPITTCAFYRGAASHMWSDGSYDPTLFRWTPIFSRNQKLQRALTTTRVLGRRKHHFRQLVPGIRRRIRDFMSAQEELMSKALQMLQGTVYLDGCKSIARAELFLSQPEYGTTPIVLLVRKPDSWCASWMAKRPKASVRDAIRTWTEYNLRSLRLAQAFPDTRLHIVRYEDLCSDPAWSLRRILQFLQLEYCQEVLSPDSRVEHHVLGNNMRLDFDGRVRPAKDRGKELAQEHRAHVLDACHELMRVLEYNVDPK